jgi:hypothetical protein
MRHFNTVSLILIVLYLSKKKSIWRHKRHVHLDLHGSDLASARTVWLSTRYMIIPFKYSYCCRARSHKWHNGTVANDLPSSIPSNLSNEVPDKICCITASAGLPYMM